MNDSGIRDFLGVQGGAPLRFLPTIQLADFSETAVGEYVEARAFVAGTVTPLAIGEFPFFGLWSQAPGGLVVTDIGIEVSHPTNQGGAFIGRYEADAPPAGSLGPFDPVQFGSQDAVSQIYTRSAFTGAFTDGSFAPRSFRIQPGTRWFVPAGSWLGVTTTLPKPLSGVLSLEVHVTWRELAPPNRGS